MKQSIYQISTELQSIFNQIEDNDGIISEEMENALMITQEQLEQKGIGYGYKCLDIDAEIGNIDAEIERLTKYKEQNKKLKERLKTTLSVAMQHFGIDELKTSTLKINFRKSESVEITNEDLVNEKFKVEKITKSISKTAIKEAIKNGEVVLGAELSQNLNLQIK
jgi:uncharacterized protein (DUF342 family)